MTVSLSLPPFPFVGGLTLRRACVIFLLSQYVTAQNAAAKRDWAAFFRCVMSRIVTNSKNLRIHMQRFVDMHR